MVGLHNGLVLRHEIYIRYDTYRSFIGTSLFSWTVHVAFTFCYCDRTFYAFFRMICAYHIFSSLVIG